MMQIQTQRRDAICWITLIGKMWSPKDLAELETHIEQCGSDDSIAGVVLDFRGISFISSHGLGYLVKLFDVLRKKGVRMALYSPKDEIKEVIELSAVNRIVPLFEKEDEMMRTLTQK